MNASERQYVVVSDGLDIDQLETIETIAREASWHVIRANTATDIRVLPLQEIAAMYISTDVLGESSKTQLTPLMSLFCEIALNAPTLEWLQASSAGLDRPQYQSLLERGVTVSHAGGVAAKTVAQAAIAGVLALARDFPRFMALQRNRRWVPARGADAPLDLPGQTAIVVGLGSIGQEIVRLCQALGLNVIGLNRSGRPPADLDVETQAISSLRRLLTEADWLLLSCPLTDETRHLIDDEQLRLMKPSARIVDVSRGGVVNSAALLAALKNRDIAGAYLDVFETEPLPADSAFWDLPNTIITPHAAGDSAGRANKLTQLFIENFKRFVSGQPLINATRYNAPYNKNA